MSNENLGSSDEFRLSVGWTGCVILLFAGLVSGAGLWGLYLGARALLMMLGVKFTSM